jgi:hypothetical protein
VALACFQRLSRATLGILLPVRHLLYRNLGMRLLGGNHHVAASSCNASGAWQVITQP